MTERSQINSHPIIDRSMDQPQVKSRKATKNRSAKSRMKMIWQTENNKASNKTYNRQPYKVHYWQKANKTNPPSVTKQDNVNITIHGQPDVSSQKKTNEHREINKEKQNKNLVAAKTKIISRRAE